MLTALTIPNAAIFIGAVFCTLAGYGLRWLLDKREFASSEEWRLAYELAHASRMKIARRIRKIIDHPIKPGTNGTARYLQRIARGEEG